MTNLFHLISIIIDAVIELIMRIMRVLISSLIRLVVMLFFIIMIRAQIVIISVC